MPPPASSQGHQAALGRLTVALTQAAAAVSMSVGTYLPLRSAHAVGSAARGASAPTEGGKGWGYIVAAARLQLVYYYSPVAYCHYLILVLRI